MEENKGQYNQIFTKLVLDNQGDETKQLYGMLAYAKYKIEKNRWIKHFPSTPTEEEKQSFFRTYDDERLEELMNHAKLTIIDFAEGYSQVQLNEQLDNYKNELLVNELDSLVDRVKTKFSTAVWQGIVASVGFSFFLFISAIVIQLAVPKSGFGKIVQYIFSSDKKEIIIIDKKNTDNNN